MSSQLLQPVGTLDQILLQICYAIQLTPSQYTTAVGHYEDAGEWLNASDSELASIKPIDIFPQGSMLLRTTNRPISARGEDIPFDLDLICKCIVDPYTTHARDLYLRIDNRLRRRADFAKRLSRQNRCLRLDYSAGFYLDVIPACPDPIDALGVSLLIPDRGLWKEDIQPIQSWKKTDPVRFAAWFEANCAVETRTQEVLLSAAARVEPVPPPRPASQDSPLRNVVRLIKRFRDLTFLKDSCVPSSILVTTLATRHYRGQVSLSDSLEAVLSGIQVQIQIASPARIEVLNPTNPSEDFVTALNDQAYGKFCKMIGNMRDTLSDARNGIGIQKVLPMLAQTFGDRVVEHAALAAEREAKRAHDEGRLGTLPASGLAILPGSKVQAGAQPMRRSDFHRND